MLAHLTLVSYLAYGLWALVFIVWPGIVMYRERGQPRHRGETPRDDILRPSYSH